MNGEGSVSPEQGIVLVVDDVEANRDLLSRRLQRQGHTVMVAENGLQAIDLVQQQPFDIVLCDIMMPGMNGYQVLEHLKADPNLRHIPIIMISALNDIDSVVRCIELGAEDYLFKPFNPTLLRARIAACLEKKRLRDQERAFLEKLKAEQAKSERLLLSILPQPIAEQLKQKTAAGNAAIQAEIAEDFSEATVLFADIVNFTQLASRRSPLEVVTLLNRIFSSFDQLAEQHQLEKVKTIGDAYMVVGGVPTPQANHAEAIAEMALDIQTAITRFNQEFGETLSIRMGISTGPVVGGVIGTKKFIYDLWGDTVNIASRMESQGLPDRIQVSEMTYQQLHDKYQFEYRGGIEIKGKGEMSTYWLQGRVAAVT